MQGRCPLVVAHRDSLRAIIKSATGMSAEAMMKIDVERGVPMVIEFDEDMKVTARYDLEGPRAHLPDSQ